MKPTPAGKIDRTPNASGSELAKPKRPRPFCLKIERVSNGYIVEPYVTVTNEIPLEETCVFPDLPTMAAWMDENFKVGL